MTRFLWILGSAVLTALATRGLGWWGVAVAGAVVGVLRRDDRFAALLAGLGAVLGWGGLLAFTLSRAAGPTLATISPVLRLTPERFVFVTLAFAALLATSAAALARALTRPAAA